MLKTGVAVNRITMKYGSSTVTNPINVPVMVQTAFEFPLTTGFLSLVGMSWKHNIANKIN